MDQHPVIIAGAGIGGLSAAVRLAAAGKPVVLLEQAGQVGGKMGELRQGGYRWDTGPSLITMRHVLDDLFAVAGRRLDEVLDLQPLEPITRCFFADGARLDLSRDLPAMLETIAQWEVRDVEGYLAFLAYVARLYRITGPLFIFDQPPRWQSLLHVTPRDALRFDGLRTMQQAIESFVRSPNLRQVLGMFATYVGASPYLAPAALNVIAHVEINQGVWWPRGGVYRIAEALAALASDLGVEIRLNQAVEGIVVKHGRAVGVRLADGTELPAAAVMANVDVANVLTHWLPQTPQVVRRRRALLSQPRSGSAFVLMLGVRGLHPQLSHHNEFFSADYRREFEQIFAHGRPPDDPTVYISITARADAQDAPPGCENWFVQVNVPPVGPGWDWTQQSESYANRVLEVLARRGLDVRSQIEQQRIVTPLDLAAQTGAWGGALYGASSNSRLAAFRRPHNRSEALPGLYFAGGSVHPGGGVPMTALSGKAAADLILEDLR